MSEQSTREEQILSARFRAISSIPVGSEPVGLRERIQAAETRRVSSARPLLRALTAASVMAAVVVVGVVLGRGLLELRSDVASSQNPAVLQALALPEGLSSVHVQLAPDGRFLAVVDRTFDRVQLLEIDVRGAGVKLIQRAELAGSIVDVRWRDDSRGLFVKVAKDRVRDQSVDLYVLQPSGASTLVAAAIRKDAVVTAARGTDDIAVLTACCPAELRIYGPNSVTTVRQAARIALLGWNNQGELLYAVDDAVYFWTPRASASIVIPGQPAAIGLLNWSPSRGSLIVGAGERGAESRFLLAGHEATLIPGTATGLWTRDNAPVLLDQQRLQVLEAGTGNRRDIGRLAEPARTLWGIAGSTLIWSSQDSADLRLLDLDTGRERSLPAAAPITSVLLANSSSRFVVLPARGAAQLGQP